MACVCMIESGGFNLQPEDLEDVSALSYCKDHCGAEILFCDPSEGLPAHILRHVIGNVKRPGPVFLPSPRNTILRGLVLENWDMVNHAPFDGKIEDNFSSTSLHLSLTGYERPVKVHGHGKRDSIVYFVEVVASVHDRGVWYTDLDLLPLAKRKWSRI